eukprot:NODE_206_length_12919_cov_0.381357.p11 type:complete len:142 gc:universal NODE_206_length_12919_cov_0.381357:6653-7078(+)
MNKSFDIFLKLHSHEMLSTSITDHVDHFLDQFKICEIFVQLGFLVFFVFITTFCPSMHFLCAQGFQHIFLYNRFKPLFFLFVIFVSYTIWAYGDFTSFHINKNIPPFGFCFICRISYSCNVSWATKYCIQMKNTTIGKAPF